MLKKNNGVTMVLLVIIIIVMMILLGTTITVTTDLIRDTRLKRLITTMQLVQSRVMSIYEDYTFYENAEFTNSDFASNTQGILIGDKIKYNPDKNIIEKCLEEFDNTQDLWYIWNEDILKSQGIETDLLKDGACFFVNYTTGNVLYNKGYTAENGVVAYSLEKMKEL